MKVYKGKIWSGTQGENDSALFVGYDSTPFAQLFSEDFGNKKVTIRYWISDKEKDKKELQEDMIKRIAGAIDAAYYERYSDYTGYLWTTENLKIGGHDLLAELCSEIGKFLYMEVD